MQDNGAETRLPVDSTAPPKVQHGSSCLVSGHKWITSSCRRSATIEHSYLCERRSSWRNGTIALRLAGGVLAARSQREPPPAAAQSEPAHRARRLPVTCGGDRP